MTRAHRLGMNGCLPRLYNIVIGSVTDCPFFIFIFFGWISVIGLMFCLFSMYSKSVLKYRILPIIVLFYLTSIYIISNLALQLIYAKLRDITPQKKNLQHKNKHLQRN